MTLRVQAAPALALATMLAAGPAQALVITPGFDTSITAASDASAVEGAIETAISTIDSLYTNSGTVNILFRQASGYFLGDSQTGLYTLSYSSYVASLGADAAAHPGNTSLATAVAHLADGNDASGTRNVAATSALLRVGLGLGGYTGCYNASGSFVAGCNQPFDGTVTLSTSYNFSFSPSTVTPTSFNAVTTFEHEINEILGGGGQGSTLNDVVSGYSPLDNDVGPLDLYRYAAAGTPSFTTSGTASAYFSIDGGQTDIAAFNQSSAGDYADFGTSGLVQSAFTGSGTAPAYTPGSPETIELDAIGYNSVPVPEPTAPDLILYCLGAAIILGRRRWAAQPSVRTEVSSAIGSHK